MVWLMVNRDPSSFPELQTDIVPPLSRAKPLEALESLKGRSQQAIYTQTIGRRMKTGDFKTIKMPWVILLVSVQHWQCGAIESPHLQQTDAR